MKMSEQVTCGECRFLRKTIGNRFFCEREMPRRKVEENGYCKWARRAKDENKEFDK